SNNCTLFNLNSCFATTKTEVWSNKINLNSIQISFNRPFVLNNDTIPANYNIFNNTSINMNTPIIQKNAERGDNEIYITVNERLYSYFRFDKNMYVVKLNCTTDDGKIFEKTCKVVFRK
ncbi:MAG: hypothetical protein ABL940_13530, partial [Bacteroidia bacterium]